MSRKFNLTNLNDENFDFVFYIAGVDIHFNDRLGKLRPIPTEEE